MSGPARALAPVLVVGLGLSGCASGSRAYEESAARVLSTALSETRTVEVVARAYLDGQLTAGYATTVVTASDGALGPAVDSFASTDPPRRAQDPLRSRVLAELAQAEHATATARTALDRGDRAGLRSALALLRRAGQAMEQDEEALQ